MIRFSLPGTGDVRQVPVFGCECKVCYQSRVDVSRRRRPCCALLETPQGNLLIDGGLTDLAERFEQKGLNAILLTHYHVDHVQGLFHLRWGMGDKIPVYGPDDTQGCADLLKHPGILNFMPAAEPFQRFELLGIGVTPIPLQHSKPTYGYLLEYNNSLIAYLTDTVGLPEQTQIFLKQLLKERHIDLLAIDCSHPPQNTTPRNHNDLNMALEIHHSLRPCRTVLTHISHEMDLWLSDHPGSLPDHVQVARDNDDFLF